MAITKTEAVTALGNWVSVKGLVTPFIHSLMQQTVIATQYCTNFIGLVDTVTPLPNNPEIFL